MDPSLIDPVTLLPEAESDHKLHVAGRNRKRLMNGDDLDIVVIGDSGAKYHVQHSGGSRPVVNKKRRFLSSSDEDEKAPKKSAVAWTDSGLPADEGADVASTSAPSDPYSHLEIYLAKLTREFPLLDPLVIQDALLQTGVKANDARQILNALNGARLNRLSNGFQASQHRPLFNQQPHGQSQQVQVQRSSQDVRKKPRPKPSTSSVETNAIKDKYRLIGDDVYDSDESDDERETVDRQTIVKFLQEAPMTDLLKVKGLSDRKANILVQARPFESWKQLLTVVKSTKHLNLEQIVEGAKGFINSRVTVSKIIAKCQVLADKVGTRLAEINQKPPIDPPKMMSSDLMLSSYQLFGLQWMQILYENSMNGILADEMGLGKTVQSIGFIALLLEQNISGPFLVIAPASTIDNWDDEFRRFAPQIRCVVYHGSLEDRAFLRQEYFSPKGLDKVDVIITTYDGATRNIMDKAAFKRLSFTYAIFDEAHLLKNMMTQKYKTLTSTIKANNRLLLTGTPVQNNLTELLSLLVFAMPQMLSKETSSLEHAFTYINKEGSSAYEAEQVVEAKAILKPFILRRTKEDVELDLPAKTNHVEFVRMNRKQADMYKNMVSRYSKEKRDELNQEYELTDGLEALHQMRKLANHPLLIRNIFTKEKLPEIARDLISFHPKYKDDKKEHLSIDLEYMSDFQIHTLCLIDRNLKKHRIKASDVVSSGKFEFLDDMLPSLRQDGRRILLFSQYTQMLDIVESYLQIRKYEFARIDGTTPVGERQDIVDTFNNDNNIFVMLLSTRAGGLGINLTGADTVIIHDIDFNPYNDKQAENRCHRLGQKKQVEVYRLISKGTVEEQMFETGQKKLQLEKNVMAVNGDDMTNGVVEAEGAVEDAEEAKAILQKSLSSGPITID
ncbi:hypothetical protein RvY_03813 [Ramazzottius varieornatus]|uniref:Uncharacterized protein n=1 Tax=Ramazzottius varieornatus TaxID=947166 RepID=A0A1D1UPD3_RAMVA|nr:hypothetical protein RvY_03813 [Ramazzottius varieornatus]